jgi:Zn-dependent peptidase ImmA (M78 family)
MYFKYNDQLTYGYYDPEYQKIMINRSTPTNEYLVVVVAHELVHCLGFDHTGKTRNEAEKDIYRKDLMNGVIENINNSRLYDGYIQTIQKVIKMLLPYYTQCLLV